MLCMRHLYFLKYPSLRMPPLLCFLVLFMGHLCSAKVSNNSRLYVDVKIKNFNWKNWREYVYIATYLYKEVLGISCEQLLGSR